MSMACLYLLNKCDCSVGKQFPKFQFELQKHSVHHSLLYNMFGKAERSFDRRVKNLKCGCHGSLLLQPCKATLK